MRLGGSLARYKVPLTVAAVGAAIGLAMLSRRGGGGGAATVPAVPTYDSTATDIASTLQPIVEDLAANVGRLGEQPGTADLADAIGTGIFDQLNSLFTRANPVAPAATTAAPPPAPPAAAAAALPAVNAGSYAPSYALFDPAAPGGGFIDLGVAGAGARNVSGGAPVYGLLDGPQPFGPVVAQGAAVKPGARLYTPRAFADYVVG